MCPPNRGGGWVNNNTNHFVFFIYSFKIIDLVPSQLALCLAPKPLSQASVCLSVCVCSSNTTPHRHVSAWHHKTLPGDCGMFALPR